MVTDKITAYPRKKLFIEVLTQDVRAKSCILDLIDNSVDSYIRNKIQDKREIELIISENEFEIFDTCGGINKEFLKTNVFRFGAENLNREDPTLGMYGIGMKRSIFKIGNNITLETDDGKDYSLMELDVKQWEDKNEQDWDIPFETDNTTLNGTLPYTRIKITNLHKDISEKFSLVTFQNDITATLKRTYCLIIKDQISFKLNKIELEPDKLIVPYDKDYSPSVHIEDYQNINIHIICFLDPSKGTRLKDAVNTIGWNIFCNNRLILANDITPVTGWIGGTDKSLLPKYHTIFNEFRGIVFLKSNNPFNLPLNTSKDNLNIEDKNYHYILNKMIITARPVIDYLTKKYNSEKEEEDAIEDAIEQNIDLTYNPSETKQANEITQPSTFNAPPQKSTKKDLLARISYTQKKDLVDKVKTFFEVSSNKEVGEKTFEYFIEREDIENE
jgi:hypothetical protein